MAERGTKILDTDLQLYLTGELEGKKLARVSELDAKPLSKLTRASDRRAKEVLEKLREVDQMFEAAALESFPMPVEFENQVEQILASKAKAQKKNTTTILDKIKAYFTGPNVWSFAGGGAATSFAMLAVIQIQPALLTSPDQVMQTQGSVYRSIEAADISCGIKKDGSWIVTDEFLIQIPVCSASGDKRLLVNGGKVSAGDKFSVFVLPTRDVRLTVRYIEESGKSVDLVKQPVLAQGLTPKRIFEKPLEFGDPKGKDSLKFETMHGSEYSINFVVD